jgi:tetratricopeptide (TPR) repeat protein
MQAHLSQTIPPLEARFPVPEGFFDWLSKLMRKNPEARPQFAADAAWALIGLGDADDPKEPTPPSAPIRIDPTLAGMTLTRSWPEWDVAMGRPAEFVVPSEFSVGLDHPIPPLPETWRLPHAPPPSMRLVGAGLGLYGTRAIPLVGREAERDEIWSALRSCREGESVKAVVLRGMAGAGKSRLAEWVCARASETGNALVLRATHSPDGGVSDGLPRMVAAVLTCVGMTRLDMTRRVKNWLKNRGVEDDYEWQAVMELIWPVPNGETLQQERNVLRFGSPNERYELIRRLLDYAAGPRDPKGLYRPVVLWLDDVQWGFDAIRLVRYLLNRVVGDRPIMVILTARDDILQDRPSEAQAVRSLCEHPDVSSIEIHPLVAEERQQLVRELLYLEGDLAAEVEDRTGGNPLFAVQLVGDWVQRGVLEVGESGFVLRDGEEAVLPDDIHELWDARISRALEGHSTDARAALELAAIMGAVVDMTEWTGACLVAGLTVPRGLILRLSERRLARADAKRWAFGHGMLRESLERSAGESGRATGLHHACATTLQIRYDAARLPGIAERLGRHLFLAGRPEEALEPLRSGALERRAMSDYGAALRLLDLREEVLGVLDLAPSDARWGEGWVARAHTLLGQGRLDQAEERAMKAVAAGRTHNWRYLLAPALRMAGTAASQKGRLSDAQVLLLEGEVAGKDVGDEFNTAHCLCAASEVFAQTGERDQAIKYARRSLARFSAIEDHRGEASALMALANGWRTANDLEKAREYAERATALFEKIGGRFGIATARNTLGDTLRAAGKFEEAAVSYQLASEVLKNIGSPEHWIPTFNRGLLLVKQGKFEEARPQFDAAMSEMVRKGRTGLQGALHAALLPCLAAEESWGDWDSHMADAKDRLTRSGFVDPDVAEAAEVGARVAEEQGESSRALQALEIAYAQWRALGNTDRCAMIAQRISALGGRIATFEE